LPETSNRGTTAVKQQWWSAIILGVLILAQAAQAGDPCWTPQECAITISPARACPSVVVPCPLPPLVAVPTRVCAFPVAPCPICPNIVVPGRICGGPVPPERICAEIAIPCRPMPAVVYPRKICTIYAAAPCQRATSCLPGQSPRWAPIQPSAQ
jgi:hypothetical protein